MNSQGRFQTVVVLMGKGSAVGTKSGQLTVRTFSVPEEERARLEWLRAGLQRGARAWTVLEILLTGKPLWIQDAAEGKQTDWFCFGFQSSRAVGSLVTSVELEALVSRLMCVVPKVGDLDIRQRVSKLFEAALVLQPQPPFCSLIAPTPGKPLAEVHLMRKSDLCLSAYKNWTVKKTHFMLCVVWFFVLFLLSSALIVISLSSHRDPKHPSVPYHYYEPSGPDECTMYLSHERGRKGSHHRFITEKRVFKNWARTFNIRFFQPDWKPEPPAVNNAEDKPVF